MQRRHSKKRDAIWDALIHAGGAVSAGELHAKLPHIDRATIYRNLERFVTDKDVKKLSFDGSEAKYEYQREPHHHAICTECEKVIHFTAPDEKIKTLLGIEEFQVDELEVTVRGICNHK